MSEFIKTFGEFFSNLDWKLLVAAVVMILIVVTVSYITFTTILSIHRRKKAVRVNLPALETLGEDFTKNKPQFVTEEGLETELIDQDEDLVINPSKPSENAFIESLIIESKQFIPLEEENPINLPEVGEFNIEEFKQEKITEVLKKKEESIQHLKDLALAENSDSEITIIDELLMQTNKGETND